MIPPKQDKIDYELVKTGDFITGTIDNIEYNEKYSFKFQGTETIGPAVRLVFKLDGYEHLHRTRWMKFVYAEKANLYKKFIVPLVAIPVPYMEFDIENLKGMKVKTIWESNVWKEKTYQNIELIRPVGEKWADSRVKHAIPPEMLAGDAPEELPEEELAF